MSKMKAKGSTATKQRPRAQKRDPGRRFPVLPLVVGAIAILVAAVMVFSGGGASSDADRIAAVAGSPQVEGDWLDQYVLGAEDSAIGELAPAVNGVDFDGSPVAIEADGTPKAVLFLAHWCPHCQNEVPRVQRWLEDTGGVPGVDMVSVVTEYDPPRGNWPPEAWLEDEGWSVPVIRDDASSTTWAAFGAGGFPFWVFIDGDGTVVGRISGETTIAELEARLLSVAST